jgi:hypothetical protein
MRSALERDSEMAGFRECSFAAGTFHRALERPLGRSLSSLGLFANSELARKDNFAKPDETG